MLLGTSKRQIPKKEAIVQLLFCLDRKMMEVVGRMDLKKKREDHIILIPYKML